MCICVHARGTIQYQVKIFPHNFFHLKTLLSFSLLVSFFLQIFLISYILFIGNVCLVYAQIIFLLKTMIFYLPFKQKKLKVFFKCTRLISLNRDCKTWQSSKL